MTINEEHRQLDVAAVFAAAAEQEDAALAAYYDAKEQRDRAQSALDELSCRTSFTYEVEGPYPEDDGVYVIEEECTWPAGHAGDHRGDVDESDAADPAYAQALRKLRDAAAVAGDKREQWEDAEEALDALRCNQGPAGEWPCILRRGHDGEHEHPTELHLVDRYRAGPVTVVSGPMPAPASTSSTRRRNPARNSGPKRSRPKTGPISFSGHLVDLREDNERGEA